MLARRVCILASRSRSWPSTTSLISFIFCLHFKCRGLRRAAPDEIVLMTLPMGGTTRPSEKAYLIDPEQTEVFQAYYGQPLDPAKLSDLTAGMMVGVTVDDGVATAITIPHPAVYGMLVDVRPDSITIELKHDPKAKAVSRQKFAINEATAIYMGQETGRTTLPNGKTRRYLIFVPGGKLSDLKLGRISFRHRQRRSGSHDAGYAIAG